MKIQKNTVHEDFAVRGIAYDSRDVQDGYVFVAIKGFETDGHKYITEAVNKGAKAVVVETSDAADGFPHVEVANSRIALAELSSAFYNHPSSKINVIGVTATNGKTSTTYMIDRILSEYFGKTGLVGTVITKIGDLVYPSELTTPQSTDLQEIFYQMTENGITHATMEVSSSALDLHRVHGIEFDIVSLNNISREHIDLHDSFEQYVETKSRLITEAKPSQFAILNLDDSYSSALIERTDAKVVTISTKDKKADLYVENLDLSTGQAQFDVVINQDSTHLASRRSTPSFSLSLETSGMHSVYNALVAIAAALLSEVPVEKIQKGLETFEGVERRFELVYDEDFKIIDDHFANAGNIDVTLGSVQKMDYDNLVLVYAIRGNRGKTVNRENAEKIAEWSKKIGYQTIIATTSSSHVTAKDRVTDEEIDVFMQEMANAGINVDLFEELEDAVAEGLARAHSEDVLLLAGCQGMDYGCELTLNVLRQKLAGNDLEKLERKVGNRTLKLQK
ncbi:Mur ligase family protein [Planococcus sp. YIM B11945]|uniref:Mur ligase family protein n=1 Tax=Planococcus sp. YIM B11945 TaxID=3435410 RepID=UPI003D7C6180